MDTVVREEKIKKKKNNENVTSGKWDVSRVENEMCKRVDVR